MKALQNRFDEDTSPRPGVSFEQVKSGLADKMRQAADTLFGQAVDAQGAENFGSQAGGWLHDSADYIEQMEPAKIKADLTRQMRRNPGKSLLVAGAVGLILGAILRRK